MMEVSERNILFFFIVLLVDDNQKLGSRSKKGIFFLELLQNKKIQSFNIQYYVILY